MGDAVHRHPPSNGLGSNTSIQDAFNLAWKLALVLKGSATPALLESYDLERAPIGKQIVDRANKSIEEFGPIFHALGLLSTTHVETMLANMEARKQATDEGQQRRKALRDAIAHKVYEFDAHGVETNHRYESPAVVTDGAVRPSFSEDPELIYQPSSFPGSRVPHAWLMKGVTRVSTLDLVGHGQFTLLTGIGGEGWRQAAQDASDPATLTIRVVTIGPEQDWEDPFGDWARASEISDAGAILVRPDQVVAWRTSDLPPNPSAELARVMRAIRGR